MLNTQLLSNLIGIPSVFPQERAVAEFLEPELRQRGFEVTRQSLTPDRWNLIATRGQGDRTVMYYAHMDTVPEYEGWTRPPFALSEDEENWYGRGVVDMKGVIAAFLSAIDAVGETNHRVLLVLGVDEENISAGGHLFVNETQEQPDVIISLEGDVMDREWPHPVVVTWGRRGRAAYTVTVPGRSAHGAVLSQGINAINQAATLVLALEDLELPGHPHLPQASMYVRTIAADAGSLSIPDRVHLMIDRHLVPPETSASVLVELREFIEELYRSGRLETSLMSNFSIELQPRETPYLEPFVTDMDTAICQEIQQIVTEEIGELPANYGSSVADENVFAQHFTCPVLCIGPWGGRFHAADEWVSKSGLAAVTQIYARLLREL